MEVRLLFRCCPKERFSSPEIAMSRNSRYSKRSFRSFRSDETFTNLHFSCSAVHFYPAWAGSSRQHYWQSDRPFRGAGAGASVKVTNEETGVAISATSSQTGDYRAPFLVPGLYRVEVEAQGFSRLSRGGVQVRTTETSTLDIELKVGQVSETVEVTAETPLLSVSEVALGQVIDQRRIEELPLFAGNAMDLVHMAPGTVNGTNLRLRKAPFNAAPSQFSTNGGGNNNNDFTIDAL